MRWWRIFANVFFYIFLSLYCLNRVDETCMLFHLHRCRRLAVVFFDGLSFACAPAYAICLDVCWLNKKSTLNSGYNIINDDYVYVESFTGKKICVDIISDVGYSAGHVCMCMSAESVCVCVECWYVARCIVCTMHIPMQQPDCCVFTMFVCSVLT